MGGYQNYGPLLGPLNNRCRVILRTQKGTIVLITTQMVPDFRTPNTGASQANQELKVLRGPLLFGEGLHEARSVCYDILVLLNSQTFGRIQKVDPPWGSIVSPSKC